MGSNFCFDVVDHRSRTARKIFVVFCGAGFDFDVYEEDVKKVTSRGLPPERLLLVLSDKDFGVKADEIIQRSAPIKNKTAIYKVKFSTSGRLGDCELLHERIGGSEEPRIDEVFLRLIVRQGMTALFRKRAGLIDAGETAFFFNSNHQAERGGSRRRYFLRASNALSEGSEILFVAFCLLSRISESVLKVFVDSSTISSVVYAGFHLAGVRAAPDVHNFKSYQGVDSFDFGLSTENLVIISASQSGNLYQRLSAKCPRGVNIVTLFKLSAEKMGEDEAASVICDLSYCDRENPDGYTASGEIDAALAEGRRPLQMLSEQFVVGLAKTRSVVPSKKHINDSLEKQMEECIGQELFSCYTSNLNKSVYPLWIRPERIMSHPRLGEWIDEIARRIVPASVTTIIHIDRDEGSRKFAESLMRSLRSSWGINVEVFSHSKLDGHSKLKTHAKGAVLIVGGAIGRGSRFLEISQLLRDKARDSVRYYFAGVSVTETPEDVKALKLNLQYKGHHFSSLLDIHLPRQRSVCSWDEELDFLSAIVEESEGVSGKFSRCIREIIENRKDRLDDKRSGLMDDVFFPTSIGSKYKLRDNFAFVNPNYDCSKINQADVYAYVSIILHRMRLSSDVPESLKLENNEFKHTVLDPSTFSRYNDGVIQAAFLRAALPVELNYLESEQLSSLMTKIISDCVSARGEARGEAATEFLLAMILGRLNLMPHHIKNLVDDHIPSSSSVDMDIVDFFMAILSENGSYSDRVRRVLAAAG